MIEKRKETEKKGREGRRQSGSKEHGTPINKWENGKYSRQTPKSVTEKIEEK